MSNDKNEQGTLTPEELDQVSGGGNEQPGGGNEQPGG